MVGRDQSIPAAEPDAAAVALGDPSCQLPACPKDQRQGCHWKNQEHKGPYTSEKSENVCKTT